MFGKNVDRNSQPGLEVHDPEGQQPGLESTNTTEVNPGSASPATAFTADAKHSPGTMQQDYNHNQSYYAPGPSIYGQPADEKEKKGRTMLGLRPVTFFLSLALILVIILAAAIGGGVGGYAVKKHKDDNREPSSTAPPSTTTSAPSPADTIVPSSNSSNPASKEAIYGLTSCPISDGKLQNADLSTTYEIYCNSYFLSGGDGVTNLANGRTATFDDCLRFCDSLTQYGNVNATINSVVYNVDDNAGMCWCTIYDDLTPTPDDTFNIAVIASDAVDEDY